MPTFNLNRKTKIKSVIGIFFSIILFAAAITFMTVKGIILVHRRNPLITQTDIPSFYGNDWTFNLHEKNFRMAFGMTNYYDKQSKDDPDYVRWTPILYTIK